MEWTLCESCLCCMSRHSHNKGKNKWCCKIVWCYTGWTTRPFEVTVVGKHITYSLQHARTVTCAIVSLLSYLSFCPSSVSIVSWEHFNDRNLVLLNSAAWSDTDAKTFLELVVFPSGSPEPLSLLLYSSFFALLFTPYFFSGDCQREKEQEGEVDVCLFMSLCVFVCLCYMSEC